MCHMLFFLGKKIAATLELLLSICHNFATEILYRIIEVLSCEDNTRAWCQSFNIGTSIGQLGQELLHKGKFRDKIKMLLNVNLIIQSGCELLEWMNSHLNFGLWDGKASSKSHCFRINCFNRGPSDMLLNLIWKHHYFCFGRIIVVKGHFLLLGIEL